MLVGGIMLWASATTERPFSQRALHREGGPHLSMEGFCHAQSLAELQLSGLPSLQGMSRTRDEFLTFLGPFLPRSTRSPADAFRGGKATHLRLLSRRGSHHAAPDRPTVRTLPICGPPCAFAG